MIEDFYFDTSIWLDFHEKRGENGESVFKLIIRIIDNNLKIAYSDLNVKEFKNPGYTKNEIDAILRIAKPKNIKHVHTYKAQLEEARKLARQRNVPNKDALHAILARDNSLQLISRDKHFETSEFHHLYEWWFRKLNHKSYCGIPSVLKNHAM